MFENQENARAGDANLLCLEKLGWLHPLDVAAQIPESEAAWVLLYSGMQAGHSGRYSLLALDKQEEVTGGFEEIAGQLSADKDAFANAWFGYFGYGLKNELEKLTSDAPSFIGAPDLWFAQFGLILVFDHEEQVIEIWGNSLSLWERVRVRVLKKESELLKKTNYLLHNSNKNFDPPPETRKIDSIDFSRSQPLPQGEGISNLSSNFTRAEYLSKVNEIKEAIRRGDLYQANLTRKFFGEVSGSHKPFDIFRKLCAISPAPYSAFIKNGDLHVISSSPERFLHIDKNGHVNTRPIKGSAARKDDEEEDQKAINALQNSDKDRAENLMIVDLSRNDLARNCDAGTIKVDKLFEVETYATVHHMVSSVSGIKNSNSSRLDLIKGCFPPGSMTGTPKIKAMELCSKLEKLKRGIYSGAIGWLGGDGSADLSVVIRTIIMQGNKFEFQVGGAIVNDSEAESEFAETMTKARAVAGALNIEISRLEEL